MMDEYDRIKGGTVSNPDNAAHKLMTESFRDSEKRNRTLADELPLAVFETDKNLSITFASHYAFYITGYSEEDIKNGLKLTDIIVSKDESQVVLDSPPMRHDAEIMGGAVYQAQKKDRTTFPCTVYGSLITQRGKLVGMRSILIDITEQKKLRTELAECKKKYSDLYENTNDIIYIQNLNGEIVSCNKAALKTYGYKSEDLPDLNIKKIVSPVHLKRTRIKLKAIIKEKDTINEPIELLTYSKIGQPVWIEVTMNVIKKKGTPVALEGCARNITERKTMVMLIKKGQQELNKKSSIVMEINSALSAILKNREAEKSSVEEKIITNIREVVLPYVRELKSTRLNSKYSNYIDLIETNLNNIISPFLHNLSLKYSNLTPKEIQVAHLIKDGKTTHEISDMMSISIRTVECHRDKIRKKMGLKERKANLRSYLTSFT
jgi:PAS domain S-box-containing protein